MPAPTPRPIPLPRRLAANRAGVFAVEFALIAPIMIILLGGVMEVTNMLMAERRLVAATQTTADLITQETAVTSTDLSNIFRAARLVVEPFPDTNLTIGVASVRFDDIDGSPSVDWSGSFNAGVVVNPTILANGLGLAGESVVIVNATYSYQPVLAFFLSGAVGLQEQAFSRPRKVPFVELQ